MSNSALIKASNINSAQLIAFFSILSPSHCDLHQNDWTKWRLLGLPYIVWKGNLCILKIGVLPRHLTLPYTRNCVVFLFFFVIPQLSTWCLCAIPLKAMIQWVPIYTFIWVSL